MPKLIQPTFYFIGNHPTLDYINTKIVFKRQPYDLLQTFDDLLDWLSQSGYFSKEEAEQFSKRWQEDKIRESALSEARLLRDVLFDMIEKYRNHEKIPEAYMETINQRMEHQVVTTSLKQQNQAFIQERDIRMAEPVDLLSYIAESAMDFFCHIPIHLVKKCENPDCVLRFYDNSKNSTRRWCSQKTCGNRMKVKAYLERQKQ